jgi:pimeloyl-ACP methyl ester carboxylesterase
MKKQTLRTVLLFSILVLILVAAGAASGQTGVAAHSGTLPDGATYLIEAPANWNGTLFLFSHGYVVPGDSNPAQDVRDEPTRTFLLAGGFALAGSSYASTGWAVEEALDDQIAVLDIFNSSVGIPKRTIAWGGSLGGLITAGLIQRYPDRFAAAMPYCGVVSGGVGTWNAILDSEFAFKNLLAPSSELQLVNIGDPWGNLGLAEEALAAAQATPQGRARLALAAALYDIPGWFTPLSPQPDRKDFAAQEANQYLWDQQVDFPFFFALRAELEARAGGNPSWNTHVNYRKQLERSANASEVRALYEQAGLDLDADLKLLNESDRIEADPGAKAYLMQNIIFDGGIHIPVLTLHTTGDGLVPVQNESAYKQIVHEEGNWEFLRRGFVARAGHCTLTPAEAIAGLETLLDRLDTGEWHHLYAAGLNKKAAALGPNLNIFTADDGKVVPTPPAYEDFKPSQYLRPFDGEDE